METDDDLSFESINQVLAIDQCWNLPLNPSELLY